MGFTPYKINQNGFGIVHALIAVAIILMSFQALMVLLTSFQKEKVAGQEGISKNELYLNVSKSLIDNDTCLSAVQSGSTQSFNASAVSGGPNPSISIARIPSVAGGNDYVAETNSSFSPSSPWLTIESIRLSKFQSTGVADFYRASFIITIDPEPLVRALAPIEVPVLIRTNPSSPTSAKQIVGCGIEDDFKPGEHCGAYVYGADYSGMVPCKGANPNVACPPGFTRLGGDFQSPGNRWFVTCVKD